MENWNDRTLLLIGEEKLSILKNSHVLIAGIGGVGAMAAEMLCRAGVGEFTLVDSDTIHASNRNRQIHALINTEGERKINAMECRMKLINPEVIIHTSEDYLVNDKIPEILENHYDFVVDAIDTLGPKVFFIYNVLLKAYPLVSSMGSGGKLNPTMVEVGDISKTHHCNFAYDIRKKLHKLGIYKGFTAVYSPEEVPSDAVRVTLDDRNKKSIPGTISYMPAIFGIYCAWVVINGLTQGF